MSSNFMHQFLSHNRRKRKRSLFPSDITPKGLEYQSVESVGLTKKSTGKVDSILEGNSRSSKNNHSSEYQQLQRPQHSASNSCTVHPRHPHSKQNHSGIHPVLSNQPKTRQRWKRMEYYLRTYQESLQQKDGLGIIQRREEEFTPSQASLSGKSELGMGEERQIKCSLLVGHRRKDPVPSLDMASTTVHRDTNRQFPPLFPSAWGKDPWCASLPYLLLLIPLHVQWDASAQRWPSYEELLSRTQSATAERDQLSQELAKLQDRFKRFVSHVKEVRREEERQATVSARAINAAQLRNGENSTHSEVVLANETAISPPQRMGHQSRPESLSPTGFGRKKESSDSLPSGLPLATDTDLPVPQVDMVLSSSRSSVHSKAFKGSRDFETKLKSVSSVNIEAEGEYLNQQAQPRHQITSTSAEVSSLQQENTSQSTANFLPHGTRNSPSAFSKASSLRPVQNSPLLLAESILGEPEWQQEDSATVLPTSPRRVTASPARILQSLPMVQRREDGGGVSKKDVSIDQVSTSLKIQRPIAARTRPPTSYHRRQVPNPFRPSLEGQSCFSSGGSKETQHSSTVDNPYSSQTINDSKVLVETRANLENQSSTSTEESLSSGPLKSKRKPVSSVRRILDAQTSAGSGWISNHKARNFVSDINKTIDGEKLMKGTNALSATISVHPKPTLSTVEAVRSEQLNLRAEVQGRKVQLRPPPSAGPFCEVVRNKEERKTLKAHECKECGRFIDAILEGDKEGVYNRHDLMCASRHRHRFTPPSTPEDFWELSFVDERDSRLMQENRQLANNSAL